METSLDKIWERLGQEETLFCTWKRRKRIRDTVMGVFFTFMVWLLALVTHFSYAACFTQITFHRKFIPIPALWNKLDVFLSEAPDNIIVVSMGAALVLAIAGAILAIVLRTTTNKVRASKRDILPPPASKTLKSALARAKQLDNLWEKKSRRFLLSLLLGVLGVAIMATVSTLMCKNAGASEDAVLDSIFIGIQSAFTYWALWGVLKLYIITPIPSEQSSHKLVSDIEREIKKQAELAEKEAKEAARQQKIEQSIQLFLDGKYTEVKKLLHNFSASKCGDVAAIKILADQKSGNTLESLRKSYDVLWKAKDLGFYNDKIRQAVDLALETVTPLVREQAQADMFNIFQSFLNDYYGDVIHDCELHVAYGHPDAIIMQVLCKIQTATNSSARTYAEWLELIKIAKRRGVSDFLEEISDEIVAKLESNIRYKKELEEEEKRRAREAPSFSPEFYKGLVSPLSTWAEDSGWTDFRTGETLYRVEGRIVNAKGEEVSAAWWE